ncbi:MAG: FGGY family carbohydrate kinase, partial [Pseudomonadota bacterium]
EALDRLAASGALESVAGLGLSGQMLGAVLIDDAGKPVRDAILWNDQRSLFECAALIDKVPDIGMRTNCAPDPGITAPKLMWLAAHEPDTLSRATMLLLPKDYVRLWLTGEIATEPSDASGTMLMDCASATWDDSLCDAAGWSLERLPRVVASHAAAGGLRPHLAARWGLRPGIPVAAGAGDNFACALGVGVAEPGDGVVSLGTSAVVCLSDPAFRPAPDAAILTSPHAAPGQFLSMSVVMAATAALEWIAATTGRDVASLAEKVDGDLARHLSEAPVALPAFSGIRTPLNRPDAGGTFSGITLRTDAAGLFYAALEGVAFQLKDCVEAQRALGLEPHAFAVVGGGSRNATWMTLIATLLNAPLRRPQNGHLAAPLGAARLAQLAAGVGTPSDLTIKPQSAFDAEPDAQLAPILMERFSRYRRLTETI